MDHRPDPRRRRRAGVPRVTASAAETGSASSGWATSASRWPGGWRGSARRLVVYDVAPDAVAELSAGAAPTAAASLADLAGQVGHRRVMVRDDDQVRDVLARRSAPRRPGLVVVVHSTVAPSTPAALADRRPHTGCSSWTPRSAAAAMGAAEGTARDHGRWQRTRRSPRCATRARRRWPTGVHAGPIGAGTQMKLARNLLHFVAFTAVTEAQRLAEAAGLDLVETRRGGAAHRRDHRRPGRDHAACDDRAVMAEDDSGGRSSLTWSRSGRRTSPSPRRWPTSSGSTYLWRGSRSSGSRPDWAWSERIAT